VLLGLGDGQEIEIEGAHGPVSRRHPLAMLNLFGDGKATLRHVQGPGVLTAWAQAHGHLNQSVGFVSALTDQIPFYAQRHVVKPGLTGWSQVRYTYGASVEDAMEKLQYDLFYIKHMSIWLDLLIVLQTVKTVLLRRGA